MAAMRRIVLVGLALAGCSDDRVVTLDVTVGHETDAFQRDPAVTSVEVQAVGIDGAVLSSTASTPGGGFSLGDVPVSDLLRFELYGRDGAGDVRMRGRSLAVVLGAVDAEVLPLFAQRLGFWSRPPGGLTHGHEGGVAGAVGERLLLLTGGTGHGGGDGEFAFYDLLSQSGVPGGTLAIVPESLVVSADGGAVLAIADDRAIWLDFAAGTTADPELPLGLGSWAQVAGGKTVVGPTASYVVGATRTDPPSDRVLVIHPSRGLSAVEMQSERSGAAATWVAETGLVVAGGSATGAGVEVIGDGATESEELPFPADATTRAGAVAGADPAKVVLACGHDGTAAAAVRSFDLRCEASCAGLDLGIDLGVELDACDVFATASGPLVLVGDDGTEQRSFLLDVDAGTAIELDLREPRRGATPVAAPTGTLALVGGVHVPDGTPALTVEMLFPE
jgi:hypothetical protein